MPCYCPITAYYSKDVNPSGKRSLVFREDQSHSGVPLRVPCGRCIGCKLERSRQWALRCLHEMKCHDLSCFLTLTYEDKALPENGSLRKRDLQLFMKRLRKVRPAGLRFFACGEYGERTLRPHYHVLLLSTSFADLQKRSWGLGTSVGDTYVSAECSKLWPHGANVIGEVTFDSCAYVARYCTKLITGEPAFAHYGGRESEFCVMSRRPGLGLDWFNRFNGEWYVHDSVVHENSEQGIPRYYDTKFGDIDKERLDVLKLRRRRRIDKSDNTSRRLWTKEKLAVRTLEYFKKGVL